ncbi:MAG: hypothetical protein AB7P17_01830 [Nitrospirales bacterium]|nr:hypothetical protein [Nitrospirales bacterium]
MSETPFFSSDDLQLLADRNFFQKKISISRKIKHTLEALHIQLALEVGTRTFLAPEDFNLQASQFVKGEHLEHFPYQYLDFPRHFTRQAKFAFRSLFWWGHHVVFALIVEGPLVKQYRTNFFNRFPEITDRHLCLSLSPSLWEWKTGAGLTMDITHQRRSELAAVLDRRTSFKIGRYVPFNDPLAESGEIIQEGLRTFRAILPIISP